MKEQLHSYLISQKENFILNFQNAEQENNEEVIHQLRLSVKRTRALFSFIQYLSGRKTAKTNLNKLNTIYKPAGEIRDIQVHLEILETLKTRFDLKLEQYSSFFDRLAEQKNTELLEAIKVFNPDVFDRFAKKLSIALEQISEEEVMKKSSEVLNDKLESMRRLNKIPTEKDKNLHKIRKHLKESRYLLGIFNGENSETEEILGSLESLKQIEQTVGKWHDQVNALHFIAYYRKHAVKIDKAEKDRLQIMEKSIKRYKSLLLYRTKFAFKHELNIE